MERKDTTIEIYRWWSGLSSHELLLNYHTRPTNILLDKWYFTSLHFYPLFTILISLVYFGRFKQYIRSYEHIQLLSNVKRLQRWNIFCIPFPNSLFGIEMLLQLFFHYGLRDYANETEHTMKMKWARIFLKTVFSGAVHNGGANAVWKIFVSNAIGDYYRLLPHINSKKRK